MGAKVTALVCVQNQDAQLAACLRGLTFCDQVVVVVDRCADRSAEIARRAGAMVVSGIFPLEDQRRSAGLAAANGDWIFEVEPDETIDSALAWEVRATLKREPDGDYFLVPMRHYLGEQPVRHGWTGALGEPNAVRLYRPGAKQWRPRRRDVGEVVEGRCAGGLKGAIRRSAAADVGNLLERFNQLTALRAEDMADACEPGALAPAVARGLAGFGKSYVARGGWREGGLGLMLALLSGLEPVVSHLKARDALGERLRAVAKPAAPATPQRALRIGAR